MRRAWAIILTGLVTLWIIGCGGEGFGGEVRVPLEKRHALATETPTAGEVRLPGDRTFNIHQPTSSRDAGPLGGTNNADSDSDASPEGNAFCLAKAANGGAASADFMLGHRIDNETNTRQTVGIQIEFELTQETHGPAEPAAKTLATGNLTIRIIDARRRPIATVPVAQVNSDSAVGSSLNTYRFSLSEVFEPHQHYSMLLQGNVKADADAGQEVSARLAVQNLRMRLTFSPAPPENAAPDATASKPAN